MTRVLTLAVAALALAPAARALPLPGPGTTLTRELEVHYVAHDGIRRAAYVLLPAWYGPHRHPAIPLVISPHGRGVDARANARLWGDLPARGPFAVVNPEGQGRRLELYSWGDPGQIDDLARMPRILRRALPWLRIAPHRIYAVGGSMGGQETLLLVARHPRLLAGAVAFDPATDLFLRYRDFAALKWGRRLQQLAAYEVGGTPRLDPRAWSVRSPMHFARQIADSGVPLQIWWSTRDRIIRDQRREAEKLYLAIRRLNPRAPVEQCVGSWRHTAEMAANRRLPQALRHLGLLDALRPGLLHSVD